MAAPQRSANRFTETVDLVKAYALQETLGPLKGAGRWIGMGLAGALCLGLGGLLLSLALLRLLQTEVSAFDGSWSFVPYLITFAVLAIVIGLTVWQVQRKSTLQRREVRR